MPNDGRHWHWDVVGLRNEFCPQMVRHWDVEGSQSWVKRQREHSPLIEVKLGRHWQVPLARRVLLGGQGF